MILPFLIRRINSVYKLQIFYIYTLYQRVISIRDRAGISCIAVRRVQMCYCGPTEIERSLYNCCF